MYEEFYFFIFNISIVISFMSQPLYIDSDDNFISNLSKNHIEKLLQLPNVYSPGFRKIPGCSSMEIGILEGTGNWWRPIVGSVLYVHQKPLRYRETAHIPKDKQPAVRKAMSKINAYLALDLVLCNKLRLFILE